MKQSILTLVLLAFILNIGAQDTTAKKTKMVLGLSGPELFHIGVAHRLTNSNMIGLNAGIGPSWGSAWTAISFEHRLYFGKNSERSTQKVWFCRQGATFFPSAESSQSFTFNLTVGKDIVFKKINSGITIDAGVFYLPESEESSIILIQSLNLWPALRFELYF